MVPSWLYGTAWKEDATESLVYGALKTGFRGIDTANQRKHYDEAGVGRGLQRALAERLVTRDELFLQSKFTFRDGQDHRLPYDENAPIAKQVVQSYASSLEHLGVTKLDSYVLHGLRTPEADREAWQAMEKLGVPLLGVSNIDARRLGEMLEYARPTFVQNRCYADRGWDRDVRAVCQYHGIAYQAFSLLTANRDVVAGQATLAHKYGVSREAIIFRFAQQLQMIPLTGTSSPQHMRDDLAIDKFTLTREELASIEGSSAPS